ncbi:MAG: phosphoglucosamine mutase [bacterium]
MRKLFGTDGVRGVANVEPLTPELAFSLGRSGAYLLRSTGGDGILVGKDTRLSCDMLEGAIVAGICSAGVDVYRVGVMPTPAVAYLTRKLGCCAGVMISASHNPFPDNGIKFFSSEGYKLPDEMELEIERSIERGVDYRPTGGEIGRVREIESAEEEYIDFALSSSDGLNLSSGRRIVLDCANGATFRVAPELMRRLGVEPIVINDKPNGVNINDRCGSLHLESLRDKVLDTGADFGLAFDGDGDRVIFIDGRGETMDGDKIMALCAKYMKDKGRLKNNVIVATVMSNIGLHIAMRSAGIEVRSTQVGDRYVLEEMRRVGAVLGGEQSGHIIFLDRSTTGDGIITALQVMRIVEGKCCDLSELASIMTSYPQVLINVKVREKRDLSEMPGVARRIREAEEALGDEGRVLVRYSGTELLARVMVEGKNKEEIERMAQSIVDEIEEEIGVR